MAPGARPLSAMPGLKPWVDPGVPSHVKSDPGRSVDRSLGLPSWKKRGPSFALASIKDVTR